jgi:hypothetical protein
MSVDLQAPPEKASVVGTLKGILEDVQTLFGQQLAMLRAEIRADWTRTAKALWPLALGVGFFFVGVPLLCVMLVYLIHYLSGAPDVANIPLWGCYGIVGGLLTVTSIVMIMAGIQRFKAFNPLPDESARALQENVQWLTKS